MVRGIRIVASNMDRELSSNKDSRIIKDSLMEVVGIIKDKYQVRT